MNIYISSARASVLAAIFGSALGTASFAAAPLDPLQIPKFEQALTVPPVYSPTVVKNKKTGKVVSHNYSVDVTQFQEQILPSPQFPMTTVWGYGGKVVNPATGATAYYRSAPGPTFETVRGIPANVTWKNKLVNAGGAPLSHLFSNDPTLTWANPRATPTPSAPLSANDILRAQSPVPIVTHLHGGEVESASDGHPEAWFTPGNAQVGRSFVKSTYTYANSQASASLWYHDHTFGISRLNVYAGLAGMYVLRDPSDVNADALPTGKYDVPLIIQDRDFLDDGSLSYDDPAANVDVHPYWSPESFGDVIIVNGRAWPNMDVERKAYRFRVLNGSNSRFYNIALSNEACMTQIATDGGYLSRPAMLNSLLVAPGERADVVIDFSEFASGTKILMTNDAATPYPMGEAPDPMTSGQIMQFTVKKSARDPSFVAPKRLNKLPMLTANAPTRVLTVNEIMGLNGPLSGVLNGQTYHAPASEKPRVGSTEIWEIVNTTADTHPIHLHLIQFQLLSRQAFDSARYSADWDTLNGQGSLPLLKPTQRLLPAAYLTAPPTPAPKTERGWKDTLRMNPGEVTRIIVRFAPTDAPVATTVAGINLFKFDPIFGPGYVWHCHILEHEDNEMMRPLSVMP